MSRSPPCMAASAMLTWLTHWLLCSQSSMMDVTYSTILHNTTHHNLPLPKRNKGHPPYLWKHLAMRPGVWLHGLLFVYLFLITFFFRARKKLWWCHAFKRLRQPRQSQRCHHLFFQNSTFVQNTAPYILQAALERKGKQQWLTTGLVCKKGGF